MHARLDPKEALFNIVNPTAFCAGTPLQETRHLRNAGAQGTRIFWMAPNHFNQCQCHSSFPTLQLDYPPSASEENQSPNPRLFAATIAILVGPSYIEVIIRVTLEAPLQPVDHAATTESDTRRYLDTLNYCQGRRRSCRKSGISLEALGPNGTHLGLITYQGSQS